MKGDDFLPQFHQISDVHAGCASEGTEITPCSQTSNTTGHTRTYLGIYLTGQVRQHACGGVTQGTEKC